MAVHARLAQHLLGSTKGRNVVTTVECAGVKILLMAVLAKKRGTGDQQAVHNRAMRVMAIGATVRYRLMFPQERSAFFCMAGSTGLQNAGFCQQVIGNGTMRIVTVGAGQQAFQHRVMGTLSKLCLFFQMAAGAYGRLGSFGKNRITRFMDVVTTGTGQLRKLVFTVLPVRAQAVFVTAETDLVLYFRI